jgi:hypothetical protein
VKITESRRWYNSRPFAAPLDTTAPKFVSTLPAASGDFAEPFLQVRYPHPRRADARRSCERAFVHRKNRFFRRRTFDMQHKSGGRKPPVVTINGNATAMLTYTVGSPPNDRACVCAASFPHPRRADARRSCLRT